MTGIRSGTPGPITLVCATSPGDDESVNQTAAPANTPGIVGDKPIETLGEVGKTALTGGTSTVLKQAANATGLTSTTTNVEKAATSATGSACAEGAYAVTWATGAKHHASENAEHPHWLFERNDNRSA